MQRGEIRYADVEGSFSRRPVIIVSATEIIPVLSAVTCAPLNDLDPRDSNEGCARP